MPKKHQTILEIDLKSVKHNFEYLKSRTVGNPKFLVVVKAFAYGNGATKMATYLESLHADYFAVAYTKEGVALRKKGITTPILVLHPQLKNLKKLVKYKLEPNLYNAQVLEAFLNVLKTLNCTHYPIHIKFNTGLNRIGFLESEIDGIVNAIKHNEHIKLISIFSHLAASEDLNERNFTLQQISTFKSIAQTFSTKIGFKPIMHICNTSGILNYPEAHFDMVRSGIGIYGFGNSELENKHLIPIGTLKTVISQINQIQPGESVGYNREFQTEKPIKTATLAIGHADGIGRPYGKGKGFVIINNQQAPIVGNVCMDMIMVNITNIDCKTGDEAIVFSPNNSAETLAKTANTISYELITGISKRIKRVFINK